MAKAPGNAGARDGGKDPRKGDARGKGDRRGGGRGRDEAPSAPGRLVDIEVVVERGKGVRILKRSKVDATARREVSRSYFVEFDGHAGIEFQSLGQARDRAKEPPPEIPAPPMSVASDGEAADDVPPEVIEVPDAVAAAA